MVGGGFIRGGTIEPLLRTVERLFNSGALDTVELNRNYRGQKEGAEEGKRTKWSRK